MGVFKLRCLGVWTSWSLRAEQESCKISLERWPLKLWSLRGEHGSVEPVADTNLWQKHTSCPIFVVK